MEVVASFSQGRTAAAQCGLFTYKSVPVIFEPPCTYTASNVMYRSMTSHMTATGKNAGRLPHYRPCHINISAHVSCMDNGRYAHLQQSREAQLEWPPGSHGGFFWQEKIHYA